MTLCSLAKELQLANCLEKQSNRKQDRGSIWFHLTTSLWDACKQGPKKIKIKSKSVARIL